MTAAVREYATEEEPPALEAFINRQMPNIAKRRDRHKHNAAVMKKHTEARRIYALMQRRCYNASTQHADTTHTNNAHEDTGTQLVKPPPLVTASRPATMNWPPACSTIKTARAE